MNIGLSQKERQGSIQILNQLLSDEYVLYTKTRNFHWNVVGNDFAELHKFFEGQYEELNGIIDEVAERARQLGGNALGTLKEFLQLTELKEAPGRYPNAKKMLADLLADHEAVIVSLRKGLKVTGEEFNDIGTSDFLTGVMEQHEKMAWMLRAFLA